MTSPNETVMELLSTIMARLDAISKSMAETKEILTAQEAKDYLSISMSTIYKLTSAQEIPHYKPTGKTMYFKRRELDDWRLKHRIKTVYEIVESAKAS